jgi:hypothetical protein
MSSNRPVYAPDSAVPKAQRRKLKAIHRRLQLRLLSRVPTAPLRLLPDFLILGGAKCATTTLYSYLIHSPNVIWSLRKEAWFFDKTFHRGSWWYRSFFPLRSARKRAARKGAGPLLVGEGSPDYLFHPRAPQRVKQILPDARLVVILRNPVDRAWSFYKHNLRHGAEPLSFEDAIAREEERLAGELERIKEDGRYQSHRRQHFSYLARGRYLEQLNWWTAVFPRTRFLVLLTDDLQQDPQTTVSRLTGFLGLPPIHVTTPTITHASRPQPPMSPEIRQKLVEYFRPHNAELQEWLGRELDWDR